MDFNFVYANSRIRIYGEKRSRSLKLLVNDSMALRVPVASLDDLRTQAITERDDCDYTTLQKAALVVAGVIVDPSEDDNSALYEAMGCVRKSNRASGLTRKYSEPVKVKSQINSKNPQSPRITAETFDNFNVSAVIVFSAVSLFVKVNLWRCSG